MSKDEILKLRINSSLKEAFKSKCKNEGYNMSQVIESLIRKSMVESSTY